jgi:hypothetical protein
VKGPDQDRKEPGAGRSGIAQLLEALHSAHSRLLEEIFCLSLLPSAQAHCHAVERVEVRLEQGVAGVRR